MKNKITFILFLFLSLNAIAQDKKFSIEIGYPLSLNSNKITEIQGLADVSLKYRFADTESITYGASYTFDWLKTQNQSAFQNLENNQLFHHINAFGEFKVIGKEKLHPFIAMGFTLLSTKNEYFVGDPMGNPIVETKQRNNPGFNFNFGASYDISSRFFIQSNFHYIKTYGDFGGQKIGANTNLLKVGAGFRF